MTPDPHADDAWSFAVVADMHVGSPRSYRFQPAWNDQWQTARRQILGLDPDLLLVGGDMTRDGATHRFELEAIKADLDALPFPAHVIPGNHEVGNKYSAGSSVAIQPGYLARYASVFGPSAWSFVHKNVRFTGFNAFLLGTGFPEEATLRRWLEAQTRLDRAPHHVWLMHPALFADHPDEADFDPAVDRTAWYFALDGTPRRYLLDVFRASGATHLVTGHIHCRRHVVVDGLHVHFAPSTAFPQWGDRWPDGDPTPGFLHVTVAGSGLTWHFVPLAARSTRTGYGPGGNPPLEGRDYSVAWEQDTNTAGT